VPIGIARGQRKTILMEYFQGDENSAPINLTGALFSIHDANFPAEAEFQAVDLANGRVNLIITADGSSAMSPTRVNWLKVMATTGPAWEDVSPRIEFQVEP
jgi:hypothetical protein